MLLDRPGALRDAVAPLRSGDRLVGVNRVAVDLDLRNAIRPRGRQAAADADRRAFLRVGAAAPIDGHLARGDRAVALDAALHVDDRLVARERRDERLLAV